MEAFTQIAVMFMHGQGNFFNTLVYSIIREIYHLSFIYLPLKFDLYFYDEGHDAV